MSEKTTEVDDTISFRVQTEKLLKMIFNRAYVRLYTESAAFLDALWFLMSHVLDFNNSALQEEF